MQPRDKRQEPEEGQMPDKEPLHWKRGAKRTYSNPTLPKKRGPHVPKDAAGTPQKHKSMPQMQVHEETPHEIGKEDANRKPPGKV
jgi:hypothetical protein